MSIYQNICDSMLEVKTLRSHLTSLQKLNKKAVDPKIKSLIRGACKEIAGQIPRLPKQNILFTLDRVDKSQKSHIQILLVYCTRSLKSEKPEWQIAAEANGWGPIS